MTENVGSQFSLVILICIFPKTVRNSRTAKPHFGHCANKGGGGAFVVEDGT